MDKSGTSWISRNVSKPSLDSFGTWFEGRLTKFVAGEGSESPTPDVSSTPGKDSLTPATIGPFSHFDAISPAPTSTSFLNRAASSANLSGGFPPSSGSEQTFPKRSGSAMALRPGPFGMQPLDRSSSALDFTRNGNPPPVHQPLYSADHAQDSFDRSDAPYASYRHSTESSSSSISTYGEQIPSNHSPPAAPAEEPSYWGSNSSSYDQPTEHNTPKANTFESGQQWGSSSYGIDTSGGQNSYSSDATETATEETNGGGWGSRGGGEEDGGEEDDDDLGLGNSKGKKSKARRGSGEGEGSGDGGKKDAEETPKGKEKEKKEEEAKAKGSSFVWFRLKLSDSLTDLAVLFFPVPNEQKSSLLPRRGGWVVSGERRRRKLLLLELTVENLLLSRPSSERRVLSTTIRSSRNGSTTTYVFVRLLFFDLPRFRC